MRPLQHRLYRTASWVLVVVVLASSFAALLGSAAAAAPTYVLNGFVDQPGGLSAPPVPAGVTVDLTSRASGSVYTTTVTGRGGQFAFTAGVTNSELAPGYWGLSVPAMGNVTLSGCARCAVLPQQQTPVYRFYNSTVLTNSTYSQVLTNVTILPYNVTLNGTVSEGGAPVAGTTVQLLAPTYNGLVLVANVSNATGFYNLSVPFGSWVLQFSHVSGSNLYTNTSLLTVSSRATIHVNPVLRNYAISGRIYSSVNHGYVTTVGNATLFDPTNQYLYSTTTPPGGYYAFPSYPAGFTKGSQTFDVVVASVGFQPAWYSLSVSSPTPSARSVTVPPLTGGETGGFDTVLNFTGVSPTTGKGSLNVSTIVRLGNDTVLPQLPNASVGQLWAQLGLDFNRTLSLPATDVGSLVKAWIASQGPFFPTVQAGTTINGTAFLGPTAAQGLGSFSTTCSSGYCGLSSGSSIGYSWANSYTLNGTLTTSASSYVIAFRFAHPTTSTEVYNYTLILPKGYALYAGTTAPAQTVLLGKGPEGSWTNFTLQSRVSPTAGATATFTIVRESNFTANLAVSSANFTFSGRNILNATHNNYTVVLGIGENATFSTSPSVYPAGVNGTLFKWTFGDGVYSNVTNVTTNHTYAKTGTYNGNLTIVASTGKVNWTTFNVSVVNTVPTARIASNTTGYENRSAAGTKFLYVNWTRTLQFNATATKIASPNNLSSALYTLNASGFTTSANFSASAGANPFANWTFAFGANTTNSTTAPGHGVYLNFSNVKINGVAPGVKGYGWIYNLTLQVWTLVGTTAITKETILVNDTEPPVPSIALLNAVDRTITGGSVVEGPNHRAIVRLNGGGSVDYGNGSVVKYVWLVYNTGNSSFTNITYTNSSVKPGGQYPTIVLLPRPTAYSVKLTITDRNGNSANTTVSLQVAVNSTLRPLMVASTLTGPSTVNAGSSYSYWANVTVSGGSLSVAQNVTVYFYLLSASGTGSKTYVGGSPGSVTFYGYSNTSSSATVNDTVLAIGVVKALKYGLTVRAQISWTPSKVGSFILYAYATAQNQFVNNTSVNVASIAITVKPNPTTQLIEYGAIAAAVVVVLAALVILYRRRSRPRRPGGGAKPSGSGRSGLERGKTADDDDE